MQGWAVILLLLYPVLCYVGDYNFQNRNNIVITNPSNPELLSNMLPSAGIMSTCGRSVQVMSPFLPKNRTRDGGRGGEEYTFTEESTVITLSLLFYHHS